MKKISAILSALIMASVLSVGALAEDISKNVTIPTNVNVAGKSLPMGSYKLKVENNNAVFMKGKKEVVTVPASLVQNKTKALNTAVQMDNSKSTPELQRIEFSGTTTAVVFGDQSNSASGQ